MIAQLLMEVTDSTFVAPGISLATFAGLLALAAKSYKEARQIDVEGEKNRRVAAEAREKTASESTASELEKLSLRIKSLEDKIDAMRVDHDNTVSELRAQHERTLDAERRKNELERAKNYDLRTLLRDNGVTYPEELGPT